MPSVMEEDTLYMSCDFQISLSLSFTDLTEVFLVLETSTRQVLYIVLASNIITFHRSWNQHICVGICVVVDIILPTGLTAH